MEHPLDNAPWAALAGPHAGFAQRHGQALRYRPGISPFAALPTTPDASAWADLAVLAGPGSALVLAGPLRVPPPGWEVIANVSGVQYDGSAMAVAPDPDAVMLGPADLPEMLDLVARTEPGPFLPDTLALGTYLGFRAADGALVAMAGVRMRPPGWTDWGAAIWAMRSPWVRCCPRHRKARWRWRRWPDRPPPMSSP